ncbi:hypothetical protein ACIGO9_32095 [Nocardia asteroides]|uniref:hypothetical protein n=1 Tax=Nocardia asteroides TaxID=1824 RepID=UPI0037C567D0
MRRAAILLATPVVALAVACQAPEDTPSVGPPPLAAACRGEIATGPQTISDPGFSIFMAGIDLPRGVQVARGGKSVSARDPELGDLYLNLCFPDDAGMNDLLPVATELARALKRAELGSRTATLTIGCVCPHLPGRTEVRDPDFQRHAWDATPESARANWETTGG